MGRYVTLERLSGIGQIWRNGEVVLDDVRYEITISQHMIDTSSNAGSREVPGLKHIEGQLGSPVPFRLFRLIGEPIELELEDGRRWKCFIQSSFGNLVNSGGIA